MVGLKNARSIQDEKLIEAIFHSHAQHSSAGSSTSKSSTPAATSPVVYGAKATNLIIDARPTTNAMVNSVKGAGTENMEHYKDCKKAYLGIDNIHVMRESLRALIDVLHHAESATTTLDKHALRKTGWLRHISAIIEGAVLIARNVHLANSHVLVHCSDGWDRTAQLSALAQLCLDPFYRTIRGFAILVEKDWLAFGHKFGHRTGHLVPDLTDFVALPGDDVAAHTAFLASVQKNLAFSSSHFKETSPVFHQFLDCVYQMHRQFPNRFEFDERLLQALHHELHACRYGTFLMNCELERKGSGIPASDLTESVWDRFLDFADEAAPKPKAEWLNSAYEPALDDPSSRSPNADLGVLLPNPTNVAYWHQLFKRTDDEMNGQLPNDLEAAAVAVDGSDDLTSEPVVAIVDSGNGLVEHVVPVATRNTNLARQTDVTAPRSPVKQNSLQAPSPTPSGSTTPTSPLTSAAPVQLQSAVQSMLRFGGTSWKSLRQGYQEAVKDFTAPQPPQQQHQPSKASATPAYKARTPRVPSVHPVSGTLSDATSRPAQSSSNPWTNGSNGVVRPPAGQVTSVSKTGGGHTQDVSTASSMLSFPPKPKSVPISESVSDSVAKPNVSSGADPLGVGL